MQPPVDQLTRMILAKLLQDQELLRLIRTESGAVTRTIAGSGISIPAPHTHPPSDIIGLVEFIQDTVAALAVAGVNMTIVYDDAGAHLTFSSTAAVPDPFDYIQYGGEYVQLNGEFTYLNL